MFVCMCMNVRCVCVNAWVDNPLQTNNTIPHFKQGN